jgi:hypothetical protein
VEKHESGGTAAFLGVDVFCPEGGDGRASIENRGWLQWSGVSRRVLRGTALSLDRSGKAADSLIQSGFGDDHAYLLAAEGEQE